MRHASYTNNSLVFLSNKLLYHDYYKAVSLVAKSLYGVFYSNYSFFGKLHMIGLGFKNFILGERLYILVGDCNYIIFNIPKALKVYCKKNQIYLLSSDNIILYDFIATLKKVKKSNFYKGKGVLEFKNFKFMKLRVGKKQRFM
jgi:ribosomal protein L6P/L9E